jgi:hypothetical protein
MVLRQTVSKNPELLEKAVRALAPEVENALFVVGESGTTYEINLSTSDNPNS